MEHRVTEAADVQDVVTLRSLRRTVRLDVDADQLRIGDAESLLVLDELLPLGHHARRTVPTSTNPALVVAHQHAGRKLSLAKLRVGRAERDRAVGSTAAVLRQPLRQTQDRVGRINADVVRPSVERNNHAVRVLAQDRRGEQSRHVIRFAISACRSSRPR